MNRIIHEAVIIFSDFKNSFLTKRICVLFALLFFVMHIFLSPVKQFSMAVHYKVSPWLFPFLMYDLYFCLIFIFAGIYFFSNAPFLTRHQLYRIIRLGKVKWGIYQILNIILGAIFFIMVTFLLSGVILFPQIEWDKDWGKIIYTLSLTDAGREYEILLGFSYEIIKDYSPFQVMGYLFSVGVLTISFLGNLMFALSIYFSRVTALSLVSMEAALIIMTENMYLFPKLIYFAPFVWLRLNKLQYLYQEHMPAPSIPGILVILLAGNLLCIVLVLRKIKNIEYLKYIKKE